MTGRGARIAAWTALGAVFAVVGYLLLNTTFMPYDDEGFVLLSLRNYLSGLRLYDDVFSQYGPWPYVYHQLVTTLAGGAELTHAFGRALTLAHWVATGLLAGGVAWRLARSQAAALLAAALTFGFTWQNISEPTHPGSHIGFLVALAGFLAAGLPDARRPGLVAAALGALAALLLLTKANVGLFLIAGLGGLALQHTAWPARWRWVRGAAAVGLLALPWLLLARQVHLAWAAILASQFTLAALGMLWLAPAANAGPQLPIRPWFAAALGAVVAGGLVVAIVLARGTTPGALLQAVFVSPLRMPARFIVGAPWYAESLVLAAFGGMAVARAGWELRRGGRLSNFTRWLVVLLRIVALAWFVLHVRAWPSYYGVFHFAANCLPLLAVFLVPLSGDPTGGARLARQAVAWIALPQVLHVFPVAGSQLAWATFLCLPLFVAGTWDLGRALPALLRPGRRLALAGGAVLGGAAALLLAVLAQTGWERYATSRPLGLPGAGDLRLDGPTRQTLRLLALNASIHADLLVTRPGMYSYNVWSGVPTPTAQNATHWFWLLDDPTQQAIVRRLEATPRSALIVSHSLDAFMAEKHIPVGGPLQDFVQRSYRELFHHGDFSFSVPQASQAVPFGVYAVRTADPGDTTVPPLLFRAEVLLAGVPARIQLEPSEAGQAPGPEILRPSLPAFAEPIDRAGHALGPAIRLPAAQPLQGLYRLSLFSGALPAGLSWQDYALVVRDADGHVLAEAITL